MADLEGSNSVNSDGAMSLTNKLKTSSKVFDVILKSLESLKTAAIKVSEPISKAVLYTLQSEGALGFFEAFQKLLVFLVMLLFGLIGLHFHSSDISPLETHYAIFLLFLVAIFDYGLAYVLIALQPQGSNYLAKLRYMAGSDRYSNQ